MTRAEAWYDNPLPESCRLLFGIALALTSGVADVLLLAGLVEAKFVFLLVAPLKESRVSLRMT